MDFECTVARNQRGFGIEVSDDNVILSINPEGGARLSSANALQVGDLVVGLNGQQLQGPMKDYVSPGMAQMRLLMRRPNPVAGLAVQTLTVVVDRGEQRLGLMLDDSNVVLEVKSNSPAAGLILPGDQVMALDHVELGERRLAQVLQPRPTHTFEVCRYVQQ